MSTNAPAARWIAATAGVCATGLVGSWLLLLGPQFEAAAAARQQATEVRTQNAALATRLAELRTDFARIDEYRADLAALRSQLPGDARLSQLSRELDSAARATGVTLVRMDVIDAVDMATAAAAMPAATPATPAPAETASAPAGAAPVEGAAPADNAAAASSTAAEAVAPVAPAAPPVPGMVAIPITTTVAGSVDGVRAFLAALQTGLERQLLVTALTVTALEESTGGNGGRAAAAGDVEATVGALAYVLPDEAADEAVPEGPLPTASGGGAFRASTGSTGAAEAAAPSEPAVEAAPTPDPAVEAAAAIAELEQRLAAAEAAAAHSAEHAATSAAAAAAAQAAAALVPVPTGPAAAGG